MVQTHTVGFYGPFRSRSVTLLLDPTTLGKPDFRSRTLVRRRTHWDSDYLLKYTQKYTVVYLGPIRSLLDPFQVSHTIIGTPDSLGLTRTHSDSLGIGLSPKIHPKVHGRVPWANPFTIRPFSGVPHYYWDVGLTRTPSDSLGITRTWVIS